MLEVKNIELSFDGVKALRGVSLEVAEGELAQRACSGRRLETWYLTYVPKPGSLPTNDGRGESNARVPSTLCVGMASQEEIARRRIEGSSNFLELCRF